MARNYYDILQVDTGCTSEDIKKAFRKLAKETHPDVYQDDTAAVERMHVLLQAYETLIHPDRREEYDRTHAFSRKKYSFNYREFLRSEPENPSSCSKLVFYDLLNGFIEEALETYDRSTRNPEFELSRWLDREDYMDCAFLLAEALEERGDIYRAFGLLMRTVELERTKPYFKHFFVEVADRLRRIVSMKMPGEISRDAYLKALEQLIAVELNHRDTAFYLKKAAEIYCETGHEDRAAVYLQRAFKLDPKLSGTKKLLDKLVDKTVFVRN
ncbi:DnaJ-class molecular chaperone with C-terminal Zn finger domain [Spirochaeta africana DSM 8902]|uniref:DnaJ-class molecular chaperone with C-terminal Zn finger domain n=2 Tax=Spirochaeta TaxID=146 RepID=H9UJJ3_SPIAZ|nr:DnaJ-class molecular chaperone with C-terminal Zn finger domain [Spirochaeta africana DSM 8902]